MLSPHQGSRLFKRRCGFTDRLARFFFLVVGVMLSALLIAYFLSSRLQRFISAPITHLATALHGDARGAADAPRVHMLASSVEQLAAAR